MVHNPGNTDTESCIPVTKLDFAGKCTVACCRSCQISGLKPVLDLGLMPLTAGLLTEQEPKESEEKYPLEVAFCPHCTLVQILETVPPQKIFREDYPYYSSFSDTLLEHSRKNVLELISSRNLNSTSMVVELASNDGYLLKNYVEKGIPVLGIDPAEGVARAAEKVGVPTQCAFFTETLALDLMKEGKKADVIHANNVLAHVADTNGFVEGIRTLLKEDGVAVIEVPYVRDLIDHCEFDTIYHEHLCYFSLSALDRLFRRHQLFINEVKRLSIHGGSLRLYINRVENAQDSVGELLTEEHELGTNQFDYYSHFEKKVHFIRDSMQELLTDLKSKGKTIAAYGAAAKGIILLNYIGADTGVIDFIVDRNVHKQGKYIPGVRIPIYDPIRLMEDKPDYVVLLPWNFQDEILAQQADYRNNGGKFIIPIPDVKIV